MESTVDSSENEQVSEMRPLDLVISEYDSLNESFNFVGDKGVKDIEWCEKSLEQLELSISLLNQCIENDLKDINRHQQTLNQIRTEMNLIKSKTSTK